MSAKKNSDESSYSVAEDIRDIRNDIERIKSATHNINRIMTLSNHNTIINDLRSVIGTSEIRAASLFLTREPLPSGSLAAQLGVDPRNLNKFVGPLLDKGYIQGIKDGLRKIFVRAEIIDLINFEKIPEFAKLIKAWEGRRNTQTIQDESTETQIASDSTEQ